MIFGKRTRNTKKDDCSDNSVMCSKVIPSTNSLENASTTRSNYNTDRAIKSVTEDLLGRAPFSQTLGKAIYEYKGEESLVIGLFGKWGTGKTSVANMALQTLEELSVGDDKPIIIRFAPWNYSDKDNLINRFFAVLKTKIDLDKNEEFKKKVGQALQDYSVVLDFASLIPGIGGSLFSTIKSAAKAKGEALSKPLDLDATKECAEKMIHKLEKEEQRYVFYKSFLEKADKDSIGVIAFEIRQLEHAFGRFSEDQEKREEQYINLEQLIELESLFLAKVKAIGESSDLVLVPDFAQVFYLWKALDKEGWTIFVDGVLKNRIRRLRLLCAFAYQWHGTGGTGWGYNVKNYAELIDGEEAVADICGLSKVELEQFTGLERIKLASFVLSNQQLGIHDVNIQRAIDLVKKWEEGE